MGVKLFSIVSVLVINLLPTKFIKHETYGGGASGMICIHTVILSSLQYNVFSQ